MVWSGPTALTRLGPAREGRRLAWSVRRCFRCRRRVRATRCRLELRIGCWRLQCARGHPIATCACPSLAHDRPAACSGGPGCADPQGGMLNTAGGFQMPIRRAVSSRPSPAQPVGWTARPHSGPPPGAEPFAAVAMPRGAAAPVLRHCPDGAKGAVGRRLLSAPSGCTIEEARGGRLRRPGSPRSNPSPVRGIPGPPIRVHAASYPSPYATRMRPPSESYPSPI